MKTFAIQKLKGLLRTGILGRVIHYRDETRSTNLLLRRLAREGASEGTVVIADRQTGGKGRLGRTWFSPPAVNLYLSVLLRPNIRPDELQLATLTASISLTETIKNHRVEQVSVKWPNDVYIDGKKVAGVLSEIETRGTETEFVIIGIGVNLNMSRKLIDEGLGQSAYEATSLIEKLGRETDRAEFCADLLEELEHWYVKLYKEGRSRITREWEQRWNARDKRVQVTIDPDNRFEGIARGIDDKGFLMVEKDNAEVVCVITGDVKLV